MRTLFRKQAATLGRLWVRVPRLPLEETWSGPVVQWQRRLAHIQETMVRLHPGPLIAKNKSPRYANWQSGSAQTRGFAGSTPALGTSTSGRATRWATGTGWKPAERKPCG